MYINVFFNLKGSLLIYYTISSFNSLSLFQFNSWQMTLASLTTSYYKVGSYNNIFITSLLSLSLSLPPSLPPSPSLSLHDDVTEFKSILAELLREAETSVERRPSADIQLENRDDVIIQSRASKFFCGEQRASSPFGNHKYIHILIDDKCTIS